MGAMLCFANKAEGEILEVFNPSAAAEIFLIITTKEVERNEKRHY